MKKLLIGYLCLLLLVLGIAGCNKEKSTSVEEEQPSAAYSSVPKQSIFDPLTEEEVDLINSIAIDMCPYCGSVEFIRYGYKSNGIQQYKHIKPGSVLIHDGERSHGVLIRKLNLTSIVYSAEETKGLKDEDNPLDPINDLHGLAKRFMREHGGYDRSNLQGWMNLIWFILSEPYNRYEKIRNFIEIAICTHKVVKYREVFCKKRYKHV